MTPAAEGQAIYQRLYQLWRRDGAREDFNHVLKRYARERFLYRIGHYHNHRVNFALKGGSLIAVWFPAYLQHRSSIDIDLSSQTADIGAIQQALSEICRMGDYADGISFVSRESTQNLSGTVLRAKVDGVLNAKPIVFSVDIGINEILSLENLEEQDHPTMLDDMATPHLPMYPRRLFVAEKLVAIIEHGKHNSRMKDFSDIVYLSQHYDFAASSLIDVVSAVLERRGLMRPALGKTPPGLSTAFFDDMEKARQWNSWCRKALSDELMLGDFRSVGEQLLKFVLPIYDAVLQGKQSDMYWPPAGPWQGKPDEK